VNKSTGALGGVALLLFALLIAGCGSSSDEALSKSEFLKQGNAICAKNAKAREEAIVEVIKTHDPNASIKENREEAVQKILPIYEDTAEQIADLGAPKGDEAKVEALAEAMEEAATKLHANPGSAFSQNTPFVKPNKMAESYGLDACKA